MRRCACLFARNRTHPVAPARPQAPMADQQRMMLTPDQLVRQQMHQSHPQHVVVPLSIVSPMDHVQVHHQQIQVAPACCCLVLLSLNQSCCR